MTRDPIMEPEQRHAAGDCDRCGAVLDSVSSPDGRRPVDGDTTLCGYCGRVLVFDAGRPRPLTEQEVADLDQDDVDSIQEAYLAASNEELNPLWGRWPNGNGPKPRWS